MGLRRLGISNPAANTDVSLFTADNQYLLSVIATNKSTTTSANIRVWIQPFGSTIESQYAYIVYDIPVDPSNSYETFRFAVNQNDAVYIRSSTANLSFQAIGLVQYDVKLGAGISSYQPSAPTNPVNGMIWVDSDSDLSGQKIAYVYDGQEWKVVSAVNTAANYTFTGNIGLPATTSIGNVSSTELSYIDGVTSSIQTQLNQKSNIESPSFSGISSFVSVQETIISSTISSNTMTADFQQGSIFYIASAPSANFKVNVINLPTTNLRSSTITVMVTQGATGYFPNSFEIGGVSQTIRWAYGATPTPTSSAGKIDIFSFAISRISSAWIVAGSFNLNI